MRRAAAIQAEALTRAELDENPDGDDGAMDEEANDASFTEADLSLGAGKKSQPKTKKRKNGPSRRGAAAGSMGIYLSDDEEDALAEAERISKDRQLAAQQAEKATKAEAVAKVEAKVTDLWQEMNNGEANKNKNKKRTKPFSIASLCKPRKKKKKKQKGGVMDKALARMLQGNSGSSKSGDVSQSAIDLARRAMAKTGKMQVTKTVNFAGQRIEVSKAVEKTSKEAEEELRRKEKESKKSALDMLINGIEKKKKISAVEKSSYDWDKFKEKEGIADELKEFTKDGYVEKQAFLHRVDLRKFEQEKERRERERIKAAAAKGKKK